MVQTLNMPVQVYSGIRPPQALLDAHYSLPQHLPPQTPVSPQTPSLPSRPPQSFAPPPNNIPPDAPPSYEDAIADDLGHKDKVSAVTRSRQARDCLAIEEHQGMLMAEACGETETPSERRDMIPNAT